MLRNVDDFILAFIEKFMSNEYQNERKSILNERKIASDARKAKLYDRLLDGANRNDHSSADEYSDSDNAELPNDTRPPSPTLYARTPSPRATPPPLSPLHSRSP